MATIWSLVMPTSGSFCFCCALLLSLAALSLAQPPTRSAQVRRRRILMFMFVLWFELLLYQTRFSQAAVAKGNSRVSRFRAMRMKPETSGFVEGKTVSLLLSFPRNQIWSDHFVSHDAPLALETPTAYATLGLSLRCCRCRRRWPSLRDRPTSCGAQPSMD